MTTGIVKNRVTRSGSTNGLYQVWSGSTLVSSTNPASYDVSLQRTYSQGNPIGRIRRRLSIIKRGGRDPGTQDIGGTFTSHRVSSVSYPANIMEIQAGQVTGVHWNVRCKFVAFDATPSESTTQYITPSSDAQLNAFGTTAIARVIPTNPLAGMGVFLGELHDLPTIPDIRAWQTRLHNLRKQTRRFNYDKSLRSGAGEYLNQVFGWAPLISDLRKFHKVLKNTLPYMIKFARGSGHMVHREYHFDDETSTVVTVVGSGKYPSPPVATQLWATSGTLTKTTVTTTKKWFSGAFTYYLPPVIKNDNSFGNVINKWKFTERMANRLFGLRLTPDLLYKLTPWSWAADWVTNAGDVVHNWSAFQNDGLVLNYGYIMEHKTVTDTYSLVGVTPQGGTPQTFVQTITREVKSRRKATPYGFGANPASFTAKQWGIIAALGISKQPLSLNF